MITVACIVEGHGETHALPILLRRLAGWRTPGSYPKVPVPIRVHRDRFLNKAEDFQRYLLLASNKAGDNGWILIVLDADDDCPAAFGAKIRKRANALMPQKRIAVVLAKREYEAWFIAAAPSLVGQRGFAPDMQNLPDAETPRNAKGWMRQHMTSGSYGEVIDQPAFTALMDLQMAHDNSRSFRKLCSEWDRNMQLGEKDC